tara:strand:+ start:43514 stop:43732 length:219 start_codon:yes stop_codon:yes gene_type:complete
MTDQTAHLVRSIAAVVNGCESESVMEALGAVTISVIVGGAEDRFDAEEMAEKFAENIVACVGDALDQQEGRS